MTGLRGHPPFLLVRTGNNSPEVLAACKRCGAYELVVVGAARLLEWTWAYKYIKTAYYEGWPLVRFHFLQTSTTVLVVVL